MFEHIKAILFDFDGVLIDSEDVHARAKQDTLEHYGIAFDRYIFADFKGRTDQDFFSYVHEHWSDKVPIDEMKEYKRNRYVDLFEQVHIVPGCKEFLEFSLQRGYRLAVITSATRRDLEMGMDRYGLRKFFKTILTAEDGLKHKPDPEPYLEGAKLLGVQPREAMVVEDSPNGVQSGSRAGCLTIGITTLFSGEQLTEAGADKIISSFDELKTLIGQEAISPR